MKHYVIRYVNYRECQINFIKKNMLISYIFLKKSCVISVFLLVLLPSLRQKLQIYMIKDYRYQVKPVYDSYSYECGLFVYLLLVIQPLCFLHDGFLHIINLFFN